MLRGKRHSQRPRRRFEQLENRNLFAVDLLSAVETNHNLTITGDGNDDSLRISGDGIPGDIVITGFTGTDGVNSTQINGSQDGTAVTGSPDGSITLTGVTGNITINLGAGDVTLSVTNLNISHDLSITAGDGNDTIDIGGSAAASLQNGIQVFPLIGIYSTSISLSQAVTIGGNLTITVGNGSDTIDIGGPSANSQQGFQYPPYLYGPYQFGYVYPYYSVYSVNQGVLIEGNATITAGGGNDTIDVENSGAMQTVYAYYPIGIVLPAAQSANTATSSNIVAQQGLALSGLSVGTTIDGNLTITVGDGADTINVGGGSASATYPIYQPIYPIYQPYLGYGGSQIFYGYQGYAYPYLSTNYSVSIGGNVTITAGNGNDTINVGASPAPVQYYYYVGYWNPITLPLGVSMNASNATNAATTTGNLTSVSNVTSSDISFPIGYPIGLYPYPTYYSASSASYQTSIGGNLKIIAGDGSDTINVGSSPAPTTQFLYWPEPIFTQPVVATSGSQPVPLTATASTGGALTTSNVVLANQIYPVLSYPNYYGASNTSYQTTIGGNLTIAVGAGNDSINVANSPPIQAYGYPYGYPVSQGWTLAAGGASSSSAMSASTSNVSSTSANIVLPWFPLPVYPIYQPTSSQSFQTTIAGSVTITGGDGNDNVNFGGSTETSLAVPFYGYYPTSYLSTTSNSLNVTGNVAITVGGGQDTVDVGNETSGGQFVQIVGNLSVTTGNGNYNTINEYSLNIGGNSSINAGSGQTNIFVGSEVLFQPYVPLQTYSLQLSTANVFFLNPPNSVTTGGSLSITAGDGNDSIVEQATSVGTDESITLGSGNNNVTVGNSSAFLFSTSSGVSIGGDLNVQWGTGSNSLTAGNLQVSGTILVTGGSGLTPGGNIATEIQALQNSAPAALADATIDSFTLNDLTAAGLGIFTGFGDTDLVNIQNANVADLGVLLGAGASGLRIGGTTTTNSTTLITLDSSDSYTDLGGNTFANLVTSGFTNPPPSASPVVLPVALPIQTSPPGFAPVTGPVGPPTAPPTSKPVSNWTWKPTGTN